MAILALVLGTWEVLPRAGFVNPMLLPPLSEVVVMLQTQIVRPVVQEAILITALEVIVAFIIAVPIGAAAGIAIAEFPYAGAIFKPMLFYVFSVPKSIFLPMFILIF